jgi:hypothetical protein
LQKKKRRVNTHEIKDDCEKNIFLTVWLGFLSRRQFSRYNKKPVKVEIIPDTRAVTKLNTTANTICIFKGKIVSFCWKNNDL